MISVKIDEEKGVVILEPAGILGKTDFDSVANIIDPYIDKFGLLTGLIIHVEHFPGWESFAALSSHLTFVKEHHKKISRVALSTNSVIGNFAETIGSHFVNAKIRVFPFQELELAKAWVVSSD
jgi:hypothetical protein